MPDKTSKEGELTTQIQHRLIEEIDARKKAEEALRENENRLNLVLGVTNEGIWDWNIKTGEVFFSPRWKALLGYSEEEVPNNISFWEESVHPDDMSQLQIALQKHFDGETAYYEFENRLRMKNGEYRWNLDKGKVVEWDTDGKPLRMVGTGTDITERKQAEGKLKASMEKLQQFNKLAVGRELKMIELKKEINALLAELGRKGKYTIREQEKS